MKRILFLAAALLAITAIGIAPTAARAAQNQYLRVLSHDVQLYATADTGEPLFTLPYSYYVYALRSEGSMTYCRYQDAEQYYLPLYGYVKTQCLTETDTTPASPYPKQTLKVTQADVIYSGRAMNSGVCYAVEGSDVRYYGTANSYQGEVLYYVALGNTCGYIRASAVQTLDLPLHPDPLPSPPEDSTPSQPEIIPTPQQSDSTEGLKIAMIVALGVVCLIVIYILFRPQRKAAAMRSSDADADYE